MHFWAFEIHLGPSRFTVSTIRCGSYATTDLFATSSALHTVYLDLVNPKRRLHHATMAASAVAICAPEPLWNRLNFLQMSKLSPVVAHFNRLLSSNSTAQIRRYDGYFMHPPFCQLITLFNAFNFQRPDTPPGSQVSEYLGNTRYVDGWKAPPSTRGVGAWRIVGCGREIVVNDDLHTAPDSQIAWATPGSLLAGHHYFRISLDGGFYERIYMYMYTFCELAVFFPGLDKFNEAMVLFRKRGKKAAGTGDDSDDDIAGES
ncbi:hypothetical protein C8J57DRAFT_1248956 [Mycena rebaudengoi]|nr:hypothetical protein C8J57DRAFT_1248956 [Mycena rebaudengoi]